MNDVFLLLGSNVDDREAYIQESISAIDKSIGRVVCESKWYQTQAWGKEEQRNFINVAIRVISHHDARRILSLIKSIEKSLNRKKGERWGPRSIDIDILFYNNEVIVEKDLCIPHKLLHKRNFALIPMRDIDGDKIHPAYSKSINTLLEECPDTLEVLELNAKYA